LIVAVVWPSEEIKTDFTEEAARNAGRFTAAAGYALLVSSMGELSKTAAHAYRAAGGSRLIGLMNKTEPGQDGAILFDETICSIKQDELPGRVFQLSDVALFMDIPEKGLDWMKQISQSGKPAYLIANAAHPNIPENMEPSIQLLLSVEDFARELTKIFSRGIVSQPDPMREKLRKMETS
jgi:hypothetical protein